MGWSTWASTPRPVGKSSYTPSDNGIASGDKHASGDQHATESKVQQPAGGWEAAAGGGKAHMHTPVPLKLGSSAKYHVEELSQSHRGAGGDAGSAAGQDSAHAAEHYQDKIHRVARDAMMIGDWKNLLVGDGVRQPFLPGLPGPLEFLTPKP